MALVGNVQIVAGDAGAIGAVLAVLKGEGVETEGNPDVYVRSYAHFGVDEARELRERAQLAGIAERRVFVVATPTLTTEAQNALLKTLEDAPGDALFFLIVPNPAMLLSTVRSRAQVMTLPEGVGTGASLVPAGEFLASTPQRRLDMLKPLLEKGDEERRDTGAIVRFLADLEKSALQKGAVAENVLGPLYRARAFIADKGALVKPLLEQVALLTPVIR
jgi:hypothetical protein